MTFIQQPEAWESIPTVASYSWLEWIGGQLRSFFDAHEVRPTYEIRRIDDAPVLLGREWLDVDKTLSRLALTQRDAAEKLLDKRTGFSRYEPTTRSEIRFNE